MYLFELLQNAVDDGALNVSFRCKDSMEILRVTHDGRRFTPLDVLGLSSVGVSTKTSRSRTVGLREALVSRPHTNGFMGIGN